MNEGCSACACGVQGACDKLYYPGFLWPGVIALVLTLLVLVFLRRKKLIKLQFKMLFAGWFVLVLVFAGIVYLKTESAGDQTQQAAERCQSSGDPTCEY
jgi:glucan phosphoethanolaminetransferase (alkaline phosphatase superfamily)